MEKISINQKITDLWKKHFGDSDQVYAPLFYGDFNHDGILFVGCNPSFSKKGFSNFLRDTEYKNINPETFFVWKNILSDPKNISTCVAIDRLAFDGYDGYFKGLRAIAEKIKLPWNHIDIFLYRQTSQAQFLPLVMPRNKLNEFGRDQMELFEEVIIEAHPKVIVIINAFASELVRDHFKNNLSFNDTQGFHNLILSTGVKVPIFFSSMLTGQRALDRWSYERLVWHIQQAIK